MQLVSTVTVGAGGAASIEFTSIPQTGTDLLLLLSHQGVGASQAVMRINNDSSALYNIRWLRGSGSSANSFAYTAPTYLLASSLQQSTTSTNTFGSSQIYLPNYTSTVAKSLSVDAVDENNATTAYQHLLAQNYTGTSAVTSLQLFFTAGGATFAQNTTASLYIITKA